MMPDIKNARRTAPIAVLLITLALALIYGLMSIVAAGVLPLEQVVGQNLSVVASTIFPSWLYVIFILGGAVFAIATSLLSTIAQLRHPCMQVANDGWMPAVFKKTTKGAAVMAAEYIAANYPDLTGFSPRNLRRMRDIFRLYEEYPEMLKQVVKVGWIQNLAIMEADLDMDARYWYLLAVQRFGWSKAELTRQIAAYAYLEAAAEEETQGNKSTDPSKRLPITAKTVWRIIAQTVDFLDRLWYNKYQRLCCFRQKDIVCDAYG